VQKSLPPIESLQCFLAAAATNNFKRAARTCHLSPSAFGQRIRQLEAHLDASLFERTTRRVELTNAGKRLLPAVTKALRSIDDLHALAHDSSQVVPRTLTVGTRHELGVSWLSPMLYQLEESVPGLTLHLYFGSGTEFWERLESGRIDAAVSSARLPSRRFAFQQLHEERYWMVAATALLQKQPIRDVRSLTKHLLVDTNPGLPLTRYWLDATPEHTHAQFQDARYLGTIAAVRDHVVRGQGVAVLPEYFVRQHVKAGTLKRLFPRKKLLSDHFRLVYLPENVDAAVIKKLAATMRKTPLQ